VSNNAGLCKSNCAYTEPAQPSKLIKLPNLPAPPVADFYFAFPIALLQDLAVCAAVYAPEEAQRR
jgi:hypothetical protein